MSPRAEGLVAQELPVGLSASARSAVGAHADCVGPNAIIQIRPALARYVDADTLAGVFNAAGLGAYAVRDPAGMVPAADVARLFDALREKLGAEVTDSVLGHAGRLTGAYIIANRIPRFARAALRFSPARVAAPMLLNAIAAHAWTFAGGAEVRIGMRAPLWIEMGGNPLATPGCPWHLGVLETLFRTLASRTTMLRHTACCAWGDAVCRTEISC